MKRKLLTMLVFVLASTGAWAYNTNGDYNSFGVKCWVDGGNNIQYIDVKTAGNFATFCQEGDFNTYFNQGTTTYDKVVFSGAMNDADLAEIKTLNYDPSTWAPVVANFDKVKCIDFTDVTTAIKPTFRWAEYQNAPSTLVIWPAATTVTKDDLKVMTGYATPQYKVCYAYYDDNNKDILKFVVGSGNEILDISNQTTCLQTLMGTEDLTFKALEMTYGWNGTNYIYSKVNTSNFLSNMGKLPVKSLNLCGCNISELGTDFSALNTATDYIILPANVNEYAAASDFYTFTFNDNVCVVAAFVSTSAPYGTGGNMDGYNYSVVNDPSPVSSITLTYVHKENTLSGGAPYLPTVMQNAEKTVICGVLGSQDIEAIDHMNSSYIDLSLASVDAAVNIGTAYNNSKTNWLAVPNNTRKEQIDNIYATLSAANSNFVGVAGFTTQALAAADGYQAVPANTLITYTARQGAVYNLVYMIEETNTGNFASGVNNVIMSGHLNAFDICNSSAVQTTTGQCVYSDGHIYMVGSQPEGTTQQESGALNGCTLANVDFTNAIFDQPTTSELTASSCTGYFTADEKKNLVTDMNMVVCGIVPSETLLLPTDPSQKVIPAHFMSKAGNTGISDLCIPYNFQYIMDYAFHDCETYLKHIYTTADPNATGLIESEVDHGSYMYYDGLHKEERELSSYTLGSKVKYIAVGAFDTGDTNAMGDVYVLAQTAPTCEPNAFNSVKLMGNNGFKMGHPISRSSYVNAGWIATLHFPNALSDEVKKGYTDIDREYWYVDETGAVDGEGNLLRWPAHTEFMRSWNQANLGYTWKQWDTSRELRDGWGTYGQILVVGKYSDKFVSIPEIETVTTETWVDDGKEYAVVTGNYEDKADQHADCSKCGFAGNIGWHQFLLASPGYFYEVESENYVETPWYTFCIPFDMTYDELQKYLGVPSTGAMPDVRTLRAVKRNTESRHTDLVISKNLITEKKDIETYGATDNKYQEAQYVKISTQKDEDDVYLKGGYPYFVKGWVPEGTDLSKYNNNLGQYVLAIANFDTQDLGNVIIIDPSATAVSDDNIVNTKHYEAGDRNFIAMPYFNHTVDAYSEVDKVFYGERTTLPTGITEDVPYLYNFMGNYEPEDFATSEAKEMPQYTYYMASGKIYRYKTKKTGYLWKPYICMIGLNGEGSVYQKVISEVVTYHSAYDKVADDNKWGAKEFAQEGDEASAGTFSIIFDDDDLPGGDVDKIININGQEMNVKVSAIYNLNGQYVGNSLNSLAKGVYVVNGKKIVVK